MGATNFTSTVRVSKATSDEEAFNTARSYASHDSGHGGYTGTIAEKNSFVMIHRARSEASAHRMAEQIIQSFGQPVYRKELTDLVEDKWGPAGAIRYPIDKNNDGLIFFGYASC